MNDDVTTVAAQIERTLTVEILRGHYPVGSRLPTVRALATRFAVNPATIQRAVARLGFSELVTARQGSGIRVNDPERVGGVSLVPAWLEAFSDDPPRAATILADLLEVRRTIAARLIVRHRARLAAAAGDLMDIAVGFESAGQDVEAILDVDLALLRAILKLTGNRVAIAVFNTAERVLKTAPHVAEAMYAEPSTNLEQLGLVLEALMGDGDPASLVMMVEEALETLDTSTVARYRARLEKSVS